MESKTNEIFVWNTSPVMRMIGKNTSALFMGNHEVQEVLNTFRELPEPHGSFYKTVFNHGIDLIFAVYTLGVIHGIRQERERQHGKKVE